MSSSKKAINGICRGIGTFLFAVVTALGQNIVVDAVPSRAVNLFSPLRALGAGVDRLKGPNRLRVGNAETVLGEPLLKETLSAGWQPVTYRQNTELQVEAWHWNPRGTWSNAEKQEGYFTGSAEPAEVIRHSFA
jgi:hypothetical protein